MRVLFFSFICISSICFLSCKKSTQVPDPNVYVHPDTLTSGWTKQSGVIASPSSVQGGDIFFINQNVGYTGTGSSTIYKTTDGGNTWHTLSNGFGISNIGATPNDRVFFMRDNFDSIIRSVDGGLNFSKHYAMGGLVSDIFFSNNLTGICTTQQNAILSTNGGDSWSVIGPLPYISSLTNKGSVISMNNNSAWIGYDKYVYHSNDNFATWKLDSIPDVIANLGICSIFAPSSSVVYASSFTGYVFKSTDGGNTFSFIKKLDSYYFANLFSDLHFVSANEGFMSLGRSIFKTIDGGNSWSLVVTLGSTDIIEIHFTDAQHGWAICGDGSILKYN